MRVPDDAQQPTKCRLLSDLGTDEGKPTNKEGYSYRYARNASTPTTTVVTTPTTTATIEKICCLDSQYRARENGRYVCKPLTKSCPVNPVQCWADVRVGSPDLPQRPDGDCAFATDLNCHCPLSPQCKNGQVRTNPFFDTQYFMFTSDRKCEDLIECVEGVEYEAVAPRKSPQDPNLYDNQRVCKNITLLGSTDPCCTYEVAAPTPTSDRVCKCGTNCCLSENRTKCPLYDPASGREKVQGEFLEYEKVAATATSDVECEIVRAPCPVGEYQEDGTPNKGSNRICTECKKTCSNQDRDGISQVGAVAIAAAGLCPCSRKGWVCCVFPKLHPASPPFLVSRCPPPLCSVENTSDHPTSHLPPPSSSPPLPRAGGHSTARCTWTARTSC